MVSRDKLGSCPYISRPSSCSSRADECKYDVECKGDLKCCDDGCGNKICASTSYTSRLVGNIYILILLSFVNNHIALRKGVLVGGIRLGRRWNIGRRVLKPKPWSLRGTETK